MIDRIIDDISQTRKNILGLMDGYSFEELCYIPAGMNNHLLWNFGHVIITQHLLTYGLAGVQNPLAPSLLDRFRKGSIPRELSYFESDLQTLKELALESLSRLSLDIDKGVFSVFKTYPTSYGISLHSIEDAVLFNAQHEALHYGYMMAQRRILSQ